MKTIFVDDEKWMLQQFKNECEGVTDLDVVGTFTEPLKALEFAKNNQVDLAFLDIDMPLMNGLTLCTRLRNIYKDLIVIFISAYDEYMQKAFTEKKADYYMIKPYRKHDLEDVIARAKALSVRLKKPLYVETFGSFNMYHNGEAVKIQSGQARELLALLVSKRGTTLSNKEAFYTLWEDLPYTHTNAKKYYKALKKLKDSLRSAGLENILIRGGTGYRLDTAKFDCDYYQFLDNNPEAIKKFQGEFLTEYSWGEETCGLLMEQKNNLQMTS